MLIALYFFFVNVAIPQIGVYAQALLEPIMLIVITLAGIVMIFGAVGMKISNNLGATVVGGIFRAIGYLGRSLFQGIGWVIRNTFRMIPSVFTGSRRTFNELGLNAWLSNVLATVVVVGFVAIVI